MGASTLLGPDHPLALAEARERMLRAQFLVTALFGLLMAAVAPWLGAPALQLSLGSAAVAACLLLAAWIARLRARARAFELIAVGREDLPLETVASERSRLRDRRYRRKLASTLEGIRRQPDSRDWWTPVAGDHDAVRATQDELREVATLLRDLPIVRARGVALVTRLVREAGTSPLYHGPAPRLREELGRIRHVLAEG